MNPATRGKTMRTSVVLTGLRIDLNRPRMLLYDDVVSDGQAKASTLTSRFVALEYRYAEGCVIRLEGRLCVQ